MHIWNYSYIYWLNMIKTIKVLAFFTVTLDRKQIVMGNSQDMLHLRNLKYIVLLQLHFKKSLTSLEDGLAILNSQLRVLVALQKDPGSISNIHKGAHNCYSSSRGYDALLWPLWTPGTLMAPKYTDRASIDIK